MAFDPQHETRWRVVGLLLVAVGIAVTVQFFRTLPEDPLIYVLPYALPAALISVGGILLLGGTVKRLRS